jgi:hypothetical protein
MSLSYAILVRLARGATYPHILRQRRFLRECENPEVLQTRLLLDIIRRQSPTAFGRDHGFATIKNIADYRRQVPIGPYERLAPYIERMAKGESNALIHDDELLLFALTSGTTAKRKLIPVTRRYFQDFKRGWNMWGIRAYRDHRPRQLALRPVIQMVGDPEEYRTEAGIPCGNASGFAARIQTPLVRWLYTVPPESGKLKDALSRYYLALRLSLGKRCALFLAANPSTLIALGRTLNAERERLLRDLHDGTLTTDFDYPDIVRNAVKRKLKANPRRARELSAFAERNGGLWPKDVWPPETILIGTWTGGSMAPYLKQLPEFWSDAPVRDLGLVASEGRFTIPFENDTPAGVLDITSHYFEFIPESEIDSSQPTVLGAHELLDGHSYYILPTTSAGLYRYHISDLVRVRGFIGKTPKVEFLGKGNRFANLTGEKLSEHHVTQAIAVAMQKTHFTPGTYTLAPTWHPEAPYYTLYLETQVSAEFLAELEEQLGEHNIEYAAKRESHRLGPLRAHQLPSGTWAKWTRERLRETGGSPEQYKHPALSGDVKFGERLAGMLTL